MPPSTGKRLDPGPRARCADPAVKPPAHWLPVNQGFYAEFQVWLREGGYGASARTLYGVAARLALGLLDQPYWVIDPATDLDRVREYIKTHCSSPATRKSYANGLAKFGAFVRLRQHRARPPRTWNWDYHLQTLPAWLADAVRAYVTYRQRNWLPEQRYQLTNDLLSILTRPLRGLLAHGPLDTALALTPARWFEYVDRRLAVGIQPSTLNGELRQVQELLRFVAEQDHPICEPLLQVELFHVSPPLPRDLPVEQLRLLLGAIEQEVASSHAGVRRLGLMDRAWFLLMLHCGLRTGEVRRLRLSDLDWARQRMRIEQSKGLKDRIVCLSTATVEAVRAYLSVRGAAETGQNHVFLYRHAPLSVSYCAQRLRTYGARCGVHATPHQLRHSCASLLLNAGAPVLTVQSILGHQHVDTTLGYARLYDGTVAADYYRGMAQIESRFKLQGTPTQ